MAITRRGDKRFAGIVAVGENRTAACDNFRAAVLNQNMALLSESSSVFVAVAGVQPDKSYSPITGKAATLADDSLVGSLESTSSDIEHADVFVSVCTDGCSSVIVSDAHYQPDYCPSCSSALPELNEHETINALSELESDSFDDNLNGDEMSVKGNQGIVVVADSLVEAQSLFAEAASQETDRVYLEDGEAQFITHASSDAEFSPFNGEASEIDDNADEFTIESTSNDGEIGAHYLQCLASGCNAHVITSSEEASYCPRCSSGLVDPEVLSSLSGEDELDIEDEDGDDLDLGLDLDDEDDEFESDSSDEDDLDDLDFGDDDDEFESDSSDLDDIDDIEDLEDLEDLDDEFESDSSDDEDEDEDEDDLEDDLDDLDDDEDLEDLDDLDEEDEDDFDSESSVEVELNFFEAYAGLDESAHDTSLLSIAYCGNVNGEQTWVAFYNGYPIANCLQSNSSSPELFANAKFGEAARTAANSQGIQNGLADMGFTMYRPDLDIGVSLSGKMQQMHEAQLEEVRAETTNAISEIQTRFEAALATSSMAINRNVVRGKTNPIAETLIASLSAAGVANANELVNSAFEQRSDAYVSEIVSLAAEQVAKPLESQNDFANMVSQASFLSSSAVQSGVDIGRTLSSESQQNLISESSLVEDEANSFQSKSASALSCL